MKLNAGQLIQFLANPSTRMSGFLLYGNEPARIAQLRDRIVATTGGPNVVAEMRVEHVDAREIPSNSTAISDLVRSTSFFGGQRIVCVDHASGAVSPSIKHCLDAWNEGHALLVVSAGRLKPNSRLRRRFENEARLAAIAVYADKPGENEIRFLLNEAGIRDVNPDALQDLIAVAGEHESSQLQNLVAKLALYKLGDDSPLAPQDVEACAPEIGELALEEVLNAVADQRPADIGPAIRKLSKSDRKAAKMCIFARMLFKNILETASHPQGPAVGVTMIRPPLYYDRRTRMIRQARLWGVKGARQALQELSAIDLKLRTDIRTPAESAVERVFMRLALRRIRH